MPNLQKELELYVGIGVAFTFSVVCLLLLLRSTRRDETPNWKVFTAVGAAMLASVMFVGNAPFISLVQNVVISLGCLIALYLHITRQASPKPMIVALLATVMLTTLLINQASRSFEIGLLNWFRVKVEDAAPAEMLARLEQKQAEHDAFKAYEGRIEANENLFDAFSQSTLDELAALNAWKDVSEKHTYDAGVDPTSLNVLSEGMDTLGNKIALLEQTVYSSSYEPGEPAADAIPLLSNSIREMQDKIAQLERGASIPRQAGSDAPDITPTGPAARARYLDVEPINFGEISIASGGRETVKHEGRDRYEIWYEYRKWLFGSSNTLTIVDPRDNTTLFTEDIGYGAAYTVYMLDEARVAKKLLVRVLEISEREITIRVSEIAVGETEFNDWLRKQQMIKLREQERINEEIRRREKETQDQEGSK